MPSCPTGRKAATSSGMRCGTHDFGMLRVQGLGLGLRV